MLLERYGKLTMWKSKSSRLSYSLVESLPPLSMMNKVHSPREIISTMCKTGQDALRKRKPCRNLFIHISNKSASNQLKNVSIHGIFKASLFQWNFVLFKILQINNIPVLYCKHAYSRCGWA